MTLISSAGVTVGQLAMRDFDNTNNVILSSTGGVITMTGVNGLSSVNSYSASEHRIFNDGHNINSGVQSKVCITGGTVISGAGISYYEPEGELIALSAKDIMVLGKNKRIVGHGNTGYLDIKSGSKTNALDTALDNAASICMIAPGTTSASEIYYDAKSHNFRCDAGNTFLTLSAPAFDDSTPFYDRYGVAIIGGYAADHCAGNLDNTWRVNTTILGSLSVAAAPSDQVNDFGNATIDDNLEVCNKIRGHNSITVGDFVVNPNDRTNVISFSSIALGQCAGIIGGQQHIATGDWSGIVGGQSNRIDGARSATLGGFGNEISVGGLNSAVLAGNSNIITSSNSLAAGASNEICNSPDSENNVVFGCFNCIGGITSSSTIAGGCYNLLSGGKGFIGAGRNNTISVGFDSNSSIIAGKSNSIDGLFSFIGAGQENVIDDRSPGSGIVTGKSNCIFVPPSLIGGSCNACESFIGGGLGNTINHSRRSSIVGGHCNSIDSSGSSTIPGGDSNVIKDSIFAIIGSGCLNKITEGSCSAIVGGTCNTLSGSNGFIGSGVGNTIEGSMSGTFPSIDPYPSYSAIVVGCENNILGKYSSIIGGTNNSLSGSYGYIGGGSNNKICSQLQAHTFNNIIGGKSNTLSGNDIQYGSIAGGLGNCIVGSNYGFIGGGQVNVICNESTASSIVGGQAHVLSGAYAGVLGGYQNTVCNDTSVILGGMTNVATHSGSFIAGTDMNTVSSRMFHAERLFLKADMLPTSDPGVPGVVWNDSGTLKISV